MERSSGTTKTSGKTVVFLVVRQILNFEVYPYRYIHHLLYQNRKSAYYKRQLHVTDHVIATWRVLRIVASCLFTAGFLVRRTSRFYQILPKERPKRKSLRSPMLIREFWRLYIYIYIYMESQLPRKRPRGIYLLVYYSPELRAKIGKFAAETCV